MELTIKYGTRELLAKVSYSERKTLQIEVHPDLSIKVFAPENADIKEIEEKVFKRSRWIIKQQTFFEQFLPRTPQREYVSGESHLYLGRKYLLKIRKSDNNLVMLKGGHLVANVQNINDKMLVKQTLNSWYYKHARRKFDELFKKYIIEFKKRKINNPILEIKRMPKRWGTCTSKGRIILNPELIKTPAKCIEYVVIHEFCHLIHHNHSKDFYHLQRSIMPDWEKWKNKLESIAS